MPRRARIVWPGYLYHVTQRGNNRQYIFQKDDDYILYLKWVEEYRIKTETEIYAYCLMGNHVHFIVKPLKNDSLAKMFKGVHARYAQYFNYNSKASGHVWQGRFYSCALDGTHVRDAVRYVELNPIRARLVDRPWHYAWSSARAHIGKKHKWITLADTKKLLSIENWRSFLLESNAETEEAVNKRIRELTKKNLALGPISFIMELEKQLNRKIWPNPNGRPRKSRVCPY